MILLPPPHPSHSCDRRLPFSTAIFSRLVPAAVATCSSGAPRASLNCLIRYGHARKPRRSGMAASANPVKITLDGSPLLTGAKHSRMKLHDDLDRLFQIRPAGIKRGADRHGRASGPPIRKGWQRVRDRESEGQDRDNPPPPNQVCSGPTYTKVERQPEMPVYIIQAGETDMVKIGWTNGDARRRSRYLQCGNHEHQAVLRLLRRVGGPRVLRWRLHNRNSAT